METTLIKLQIKKEAASGKLSDEITSKFIEACIKLDASIFEPLVNEEQYFQDLDKYIAGIASQIPGLQLFSLPALRL